MKVHGFEITDKMISGALKALSGKAITAKLIAGILETKYGIPHFVDEGYHWVSDDASSRIIQKLKKENRIKWEYGGGGSAYYSVVKKTQKKKIMDKKETFLEMHQQGMETFGFWSEDYRAILITAMEIIHRKDIIREWGISDIVINGDKVLLKWFKRIAPLSDEELKKKFGK